MSTIISKQVNITRSEEKNGNWTGILINHGQSDEFHMKCEGIVLWDDEIQYYIPITDVPIYYKDLSPLTTLNDIQNELDWGEDL